MSTTNVNFKKKIKTGGNPANWNSISLKIQEFAAY
jgi:hypothetical protein